jgi:Tfp pilus assembly protein PilF
MTRDEHLAWCKQRALEYLDKGDANNAVASMESDMRKHPDTQISGVLSMLGMRYLIDGDHAAVRRWIEGFR